MRGRGRGGGRGRRARDGRVPVRRAAGPAADRRGDHAALERARVAVEDEAKGLEDSGRLAAEETVFFCFFFPVKRQR